MHILKTALLCFTLVSGTAASFARSESPEHAAAAKLTKEAIIGAWRLCGIDYSGPNGSLVDPVSVQIVTANRPTIARPAARTSDVVTAEDAKLAAQAFDSYYAYFGSWEFDAAKSVITHHLRASLLPYETGMDYRREVTFDGAHLKLIVRSQQNGEMRQRTLVWERISETNS